MMQNHRCPVCARTDALAAYCEVGGFQVYVCQHCQADHVHPVPTPQILKAYYDRSAWFEGGEHGGYANYDRQTEHSLEHIQATLDAFETDAALSVLDIGCGYGNHLALAAGRGWKCFGVEMSEHARGVAKSRLANDAHIVGDVDELLPHQFDLILMLDVLEHLPAPEALFYKLFAIGAIQPHTKVVITTPNAGSAAATQNPEHWKYRHPPSHLVLYSAQALTILLKRLRFTAVRVEGMHPVSAPAEAQAPWRDFEGLQAVASGSDFAAFMQERYVPGTWSRLAEYEHMPRYAIARSLAEGKTVLDFGCGTGYGSALLAGVASSVIGLDIDAGAIEWASQTHVHPGLQFVRRNDLGASLPEACFDLVTCFEMIEHVDFATQTAVIASMARLLTDDGLLLISTPNPEVTRHYGANPFHLREMTRDEFHALLSPHFPHVTLLEQRICNAISVTQIGSTSGLVPQPLNDGGRASEPAAFVAMCSRRPVASPAQMVFFDEESDLILDCLAREKALNAARFKAYQLGEQAQNEIRSHKAALTTLHADREAFTHASAAKTSAHESERDALQVELASSLVKLKRTDADLAANDAALAELVIELASKEDDLRASRDTLAARDEALQHLGTELKALKVAHVVSVAEFNAKVIELAANEDALRTSRDTLAARDEALQHLGTEHQALHVVRTAKVAELSAKVTELAAKQDELHACRNDLAARDESLAMREAELVTKDAESVLRETALADLATDRQRLATTLREQVSACRQLESDLILLRQSKWFRLRHAMITKPRTWRTCLRVAYLLGALATPSGVKRWAGPFIHARKQRLLASGGASASLGQPSNAYVVRQPKSTAAQRPIVVHVIANFMTGGSSRLVIDLIEHLGSQFEQSVVTSFIPDPPDYLGLEITEYRHPKDDAVFVEHFQRLRPAFIHMHYWGDCDEPWYAKAVAAAERLGIPMIQNVNTPVAPYMSPAIERYVYVSDYVRHTFGQSDPHHLTIYPGSDFSHFSASALEPRPDDCVGMVYRLESDKLNEHAIKPFIRIVQKRPRTRVLIVGGGSLLVPFQNAVARVGLTMNFEFTGYVAYEALPALYRRMSVFVAPVWKESFGQVSPFAMNMRAPVIGYDIGAIHEIVGDPELVAQPADADHLADIAVRLLDSPALRQQIGDAQRARAQAHFSLQAMIASYARVYQGMKHAQKVASA